MRSTHLSAGFDRHGEPDDLTLPSTRRLSVPATAKHCGVSVMTVNRWIHKGLKGGRIKLRSRKFGGRRLIELPDLKQFIHECTAAADGDSAVVERKTARQRESELLATERELQAEGII